MQRLILAKYFNPFLHFFLLIKSTKKFSFESKKGQKMKLVYFWKKMNCVSNMIWHHHEIKDIIRVE